MESLAKEALRVVREGEVKFVPERFAKTYTNWMENVHDWCISRQLWWGHQIPAWTCDDCGHINVSREDPTKCEKCGRLEGRPALSVENTGARVSGDALPHLFEAFYREEGSRNRSTGGSGLGLYLVKMILDRHGAVCTIENTEEGVKATVRF